MPRNLLMLIIMHAFLMSLCMGGYQWRHDSTLMVTCGENVPCKKGATPCIADNAANFTALKCLLSGHLKAGMTPKTLKSSLSMRWRGTSNSGLTWSPTMLRVISCRGLISGQSSTASRIGKHRLNAGRGKGLRPAVADAMALTAAEMAGCSGIGIAPNSPPEQR